MKYLALFSLLFSPVCFAGTPYIPNQYIKVKGRTINADHDCYIGIGAVGPKATQVSYFQGDPDAPTEMVTFKMSFKNIILMDPVDQSFFIKESGVRFNLPGKTPNQEAVYELSLFKPDNDKNQRKRMRYLFVELNYFELEELGGQTYIGDEITSEMCKIDLEKIVKGNITRLLDQ